MEALPLLISDTTGRILESCNASEMLLGSVHGLRCSEALRARTPEGESICARCTSTGGPRTRPDPLPVRVRGRDWLMSCTAMGRVRVHALVPTGPAPVDIPALSPREREVLALVARGMTSATIARKLSLSEGTVRTHVEHVRDKLGARTRSEAVARALAAGIIDPPKS